MELFKWVILLITLEIIAIFVFGLIYDRLETTEVRDYMEGLYLSVQIQTAIGMSNTITERNLQVWITIQSIVSDILNILLITFIAMYIGQKFAGQVIASEK